MVGYRISTTAPDRATDGLASTRPLIVLALGIVCSLFQSCAFICGDEPTLPPRDLVDMSDHVLIGRLVDIDTLADLGDIHYEGELGHAWVVQYTYRTEEVVKGHEHDSLIFLWYCPTRNYKNSWVNTPEFELNRSELIYGDSIASWDDIPKIIYAISGVELGDLASCPERDSLGLVPVDYGRWTFEERDCTILNRMRESSELRRSLVAALERGRVIAASEMYYWTHNVFCDGLMAYCARDPLFDVDWYYWVSSDEYLDELRRWSYVNHE